MSFATIVLAAAEAHVELPMPTWMYALIAAIIFILLGLATFSYRDVANRHAAKANARAGRVHDNDVSGHGH
jgi:cytochrome c biogenesis protein CcdA